jgi:hypothetical protein
VAGPDGRDTANLTLGSFKDGASNIYVCSLGGGLVPPSHAQSQQTRKLAVMLDVPLAIKSLVGRAVCPPAPWGALWLQVT